MNIFFYFLSPTGILESIECLVVAKYAGRNTSDHCCFSISSKWLFKEPSQFRISIRNKSAFPFVTQQIDAITESEEWSVDVGALKISDSFLFSIDILSFWTCQINEGHFGSVECVLDISFYSYLYNCMGTRGELVSFSFSYYSTSVSRFYEWPCCLGTVYFDFL